MKARLTGATLPVLRIEVEDANGVQAFDPNHIIMWAARGGVDKLVGGVTYRSDDFEIVSMSRGQLKRLIMLRLRRSEYFTLIEQIGMRHEWHEDYYDPDCGLPLQPVDLR